MSVDIQCSSCRAELRVVQLVKGARVVRCPVCNALLATQKFPDLQAALKQRGFSTGTWVTAFGLLALFVGVGFYSAGLWLRNKGTDLARSEELTDKQIWQRVRDVDLVPANNYAFLVCSPAQLQNDKVFLSLPQTYQNALHQLFEDTLPLQTDPVKIDMIRIAFLPNKSPITIFSASEPLRWEEKPPGADHPQKVDTVQGLAITKLLDAAGRDRFVAWPAPDFVLFGTEPEVVQQTLQTAAELVQKRIENKFSDTEAKFDAIRGNKFGRIPPKLLFGMRIENSERIDSLGKLWEALHLPQELWQTATSLRQGTAVVQIELQNQEFNVRFLIEAKCFNQARAKEIVNLFDTYRTQLEAHTRKQLQPVLENPADKEVFERLWSSYLSRVISAGNNKDRPEGQSEIERLPIAQVLLEIKVEQIPTFLAWKPYLLPEPAATPE